MITLVSLRRKYQHYVKQWNPTGLNSLQNMLKCMNMSNRPFSILTGAKGKCRPL